MPLLLSTVLCLGVPVIATAAPAAAATTAPAKTTEVTNKPGTSAPTSTTEVTDQPGKTAPQARTSPAATPQTSTPKSAAPAAGIEVSPAPAQTIANIGASGAWWVNDLKSFAPAVQQQAAQLLFSRSGLQLSSYRYNIGGGGTGVSPADRAPQTFLQANGSYNWSLDPGGQYFLKAAAKAGVPDLIGFVNSAPASMTTNGLSCSGYLASGDEAAYGTYLATVVKHFDSEGVHIGYVSPMNEPDATTGCGQETMLVPVSQRGAVVRAVGSALVAQHTGAQVIADESSLLSEFDSNTQTWFYEPGTAQYVAALAHHTYDDPDNATMEQAAAVGRQTGKPTWATETCCFGSGGGWSGGYDPGIDSALAMSQIIYNDFTVTHDSAFQWWEALSNAIGCDPATSASCAGSPNSAGWNDGLIYYDPNFATDGNQRLYLTKRYYALAQYSKYVRPGAVLHNALGAPSGVQVSAYQSGKNWTVVVNNQNTTASPLSLNIGSVQGLTATGAFRTSATQNLAAVPEPAVSGATVTGQLPAQSITTYTFRQTSTVRNAAITGSWQGAQSGKCLDLTAGVETAGTKAVISTCSASSSQTWTATATGTLRLGTTATGRGDCLAPYAGGTADGTDAAVYPCDGSAAQQWSTNADGSITNALTGQCLDVYNQWQGDGSPVDLYTCDGGPNQSWSHVPPPVLPTGSGEFAPGLTATDTSGKALQLHGLGIVKVGSTWYGFGEDKAGENSDNTTFQDIPCYSSTDLSHWTLRGLALTQQPSGDLGPNRIVERPKVIYNQSTHTYVMYLHIDNSSYSEAKVGVATSATPCGPYTYRGSFQPLGFQSRDMSLFQDSDGTAYLLSEDRSNGLRIDRLSADYLSVTAAVAVLPDYEAPAMVKVNGTYFLLGSHLSGWSTNDNDYATATDLAGPWSGFQTFAPAGTDTYNSQTANIITVQGTSGTSYIYAGDRWNTSALGNSALVWLPMTISGSTLTVGWQDNWKLNTAAGTWSAGTSNPADGAYSLTDDHSSLVMDVAGGSTAAGSPIVQEQAQSQDPTQRWKLTLVSGNVYTVTNGADGDCLEVPGSSTAQGTQLDQAACDGGANQRWALDSTGGYGSATDASFTLVNLGSGWCADVSGQSASAGAAVIQWSGNGGDNQVWNLTAD